MASSRVVETQEYRMLNAYTQDYADRSGNSFKGVNIIKHVLSSWTISRLEECLDNDRRKILAILKVARDQNTKYEMTENDKVLITLPEIFDAYLDLPKELDSMLASELKKNLPNELSKTRTGILRSSTFTEYLQALYKKILKLSPDVKLILDEEKEEKIEVQALAPVSDNGSFKRKHSPDMMRLPSFNDLVAYTHDKAFSIKIKFSILNPVALKKINIPKMYLAVTLFFELKCCSSLHDKKVLEVLYRAYQLNDWFEKSPAKKAKLTLKELGDWVKEVDLKIHTDITKKVEELPEELIATKTNKLKNSEFSEKICAMYNAVRKLQNKSQGKFQKGPQEVEMQAGLVMKAGAV